MTVSLILAIGRAGYTLLPLTKGISSVPEDFRGQSGTDILLGNGHNMVSVYFTYGKYILSDTDIPLNGYPPCLRLVPEDRAEE